MGIWVKRFSGSVCEMRNGDREGFGVLMLLTVH